MTSDERSEERRFWRAIGGKKQAAQYMFADEKRFKLVSTITWLMGFLSLMAIVVAVVAVAWVILSGVLWLTGIILLFLGPLIVGGFNEWNALFEGARLEQGLTTAVICVIAFVALIIARFITDWMAILIESRRLHSDPEKNKDYIMISSIVKRAKLIDMVTKLALAAIVIGAALIVSDKAVAEDTQWVYILGALILAVGALVVSGIYTNKQFRVVLPVMKRIKAERAAADAELRRIALEEAKKNADNN